MLQPLLLLEDGLSKDTMNRTLKLYRQRWCCRSSGGGPVLYFKHPSSWHARTDVILQDHEWQWSTSMNVSFMKAFDSFLH